MKSSIAGIVFAVIVFFGIQMIMPFPYGIILGILFVGIVIWFTKKHASLGKDSLLNYRRTDPINKKEKDQNDEALRILEKKYIEEKISKEEYIKRKKEFEDTEYNPRKCEVCGSEEFDFVSEKQKGEPISEEYYRCKKCGAK